MIISSQGIDEAHEEALMSEISKRFKPNHLDKTRSLCYLTYNEGVVNCEPKDLNASWSGSVNSIFKGLLQGTDTGTLTTPEGGTVGFLKDTNGTTTATEIPESFLEYKPPMTDANGGALGAQVRVRDAYRGGLSPWLKVGDEHLNQIKDTNIQVWSLSVIGSEQSVEGASNEHEV
jgi:hypothetical protein